MKTITKLFSSLCLLFLVTNLLAQDIYYVDIDANGNEDGSSWTNAYTDVDAAISSATSGDTVQIAEGTYVVPRIDIVANITVKGGYQSGTGNRDVDLYPTILDGTDAVNNTKNRIFVTGDGSTVVTVNVEGVTLLNGESNSGGAIYIHKNSTLNITDCILKDNYTTNKGGAIFINGGAVNITNSNLTNNSGVYGGVIFNNTGSVTISNSDITNNTTTIEGGAIYTYGELNIENSNFHFNESDNGGAIYCGVGTTTVTDCEFTDNSSVNGGAFYSATTLIISNSNIDFNIASTNGGAIFSKSPLSVKNSKFDGNIASNDGGAVFSYTSVDSITNCEFYNNKGLIGGAYGGFAGTTVLNNSIFYDNISNSGAISNTGTLTMINSIVYGNTANANNQTFTVAGVYNTGVFNSYNSAIYNNTNPNTLTTHTEYLNSNGTFNIQHSVIKGENPTGLGNLDATVVDFDPLFTDPVNGDFTLQVGSPLINAGLNSYNSDTLDLAGNIRFIDTTIDIGAYEFSEPNSLTSNELFDQKTSIYPNPITDNLNIDLPAGEMLKSVSVFSLLGEMIQETKTTSVDFSDITSGTYIVKIENTEGKVAVKKIIKE